MVLIELYHILIEHRSLFEMKKTSMNFRKLFQKIHQDQLQRNMSPKDPRNSLSRVRTPCRDKQKINLSVRSNSCQLKEKQRNTHKTLRTARPPSSKIAASLEKQMQNESVKRYFEYLDKMRIQMIEKLCSNTQAENKTITQEFRCLLNVCESMEKYPGETAKILKEFEDNSNSLKHRKTRATFYFVYAKYLQCNSDQESLKNQLKLMEKCDQYSRTLGIYQMSLYSCIRIQKILFQMKRFSESQVYALKVLRLAVYLKNNFEEYKAIEALKILSFHEGKINNSKEEFLKKQEKDFIMKSYHPTHDLCVEVGQEHELYRPKTYPIQLLPEEQINIKQNVEKFVSNMAQMKKNLTERSQGIMKTVKKVNQIGSVNKYISNGGYITLQPRSRFKPARNIEQVLLTHWGKKSGTQSNRRFHKLYLPKIIQMVTLLYSFKI